MKVRLAAAAIALCLAAGIGQASAPPEDPIHFFEGRTESLGTVKIAMKKPFKSRAIGKGEIKPDGTLDLVQRVEDDGRPPRNRHWKMKRIAPGRYSGTMSEAKGPVNVEEIDGRYRFRFRMEGSVSVEQWLTPARDGRSAKSNSTFRKFGILVGRSDAVIRKLD